MPEFVVQENPHLRGAVVMRKETWQRAYTELMMLRPVLTAARACIERASDFARDTEGEPSAAWNDLRAAIDAYDVAWYEDPDAAVRIARDITEALADLARDPTPPSEGATLVPQDIRPEQPD